MEHFNWIMGFVLPYTNFFIFLALAVYLFRNPLRRQAEQRRKEFELMFEKASSIKKETEELAKQTQEKLEQLEGEIEGIRLHAQKVADEERKTILASAEQLSTHIADEAQRIASTELEARQTMQVEILSSASTIAADLVRKKLTEVEHHKLIQLQNQKLAKLNVVEVIHG